jgi:hypothetical protein
VAALDEYFQSPDDIMAFIWSPDTDDYCSIKMRSLHSLAPAWRTSGKSCDHCSETVFASLDSIIARLWKREVPASGINSHYIGTAKDVISASAEGCPWCGRLAANIIGWREHESFGDAASIRRQRCLELANSKELVSVRMTWRVLMTS